MDWCYNKNKILLAIKYKEDGLTVKEKDLVCDITTNYAARKRYLFEELAILAFYCYLISSINNAGIYSFYMN